MKAKDVLKDLGPKALVQIYKPKKKGYGYEQQFLRAYSVEEIQKLKSRAWIDRYFDKDIELVEYGSYYMTDELIGSCNIYLKAEPKAASREKQDTATIDYADLKKKWNQFCKEYCVEGADIIHAWHINVFLNMLKNGELNEMEDKDLS